MNTSLPLIARNAAELLPATATVVLIVLLPGWIVARAGRLRPPAALALSPALSCAIVGAAEVIAPAAGAAWRPWGWAAITGLTAFAAVLVRLVAGAIPDSGRRAAYVLRTRWILAAGPAVAMVVPALVFLTTLPGSGYPAQAFDAVFHLNAVVAIREGGNASMFGGLAEMYAGRSVYYPSIWHGIVALAPGSAVVATNGAILAVLALIWPLTVFGMLSQLNDADDLAETGGLTRVIAVAATTAMSAGLVAFALLPMTALAVWPYALSVLGLPGIMTVLNLLHRDPPHRTAGQATTRVRIALLMLLLGGCCGVVAAHGTGMFNLVLLALPFLAETALRARRCTGRVRIWLLGGGTVIAVAVGTWRLREALASVLSYRRPSGGAAGAVGTLVQALADLPMYGSYAGALVPVGAVFGVFTIAGAWVVRHDRRLRPWLALWVLMLVFVVMVGGPQWVGRQLGSPWYLQKARIAPLVLLAALPLAARAVQAAATRLTQQRATTRRRTGALVLVALVLLPVAGRLPLERALVASVYDPGRIQYGTLVTADEIALFERSGSVLPRDAVVIGSPSLGVSYLWSIGGVRVAYPMRAAPAAGTPQAALLSTWPNLDQSTCAALDELHADYFFIDTDLTAAGSQTGTAPLRWDEPLAQLPETGVELVDSQGGAQLWRITACDRE